MSSGFGPLCLVDAESEGSSPFRGDRAHLDKIKGEADTVRKVTSDLLFHYGCVLSDLGANVTVLVWLHWGVAFIGYYVFF